MSTHQVSLLDDAAAFAVVAVNAAASVKSAKSALIEGRNRISMSFRRRVVRIVTRPVKGHGF
jgi:hypothetical protein